MSRWVRWVTMIAGCAATLGWLAACGSEDPPPVSVFPIPGSRVVPPGAQIAFRGLAAARIGRITVVGSQSGAHHGRLAGHSDGHGASFIPATPFKAGETVTVRTRLHLVGAPGGTFRFTVASPVNVKYPPLPPGPRLPGDVLQFRTRPDLSPATVEVTDQSAESAPGEMFLAPQGPVQGGPMILDPDGTLVWYKPVPPKDLAMDFRVQSYRGKPVLTWWQGYSGLGIGVGEDIITNSAYQQVAVVRAANGLSADLHEFEISPKGTALITAYYPVYWDTSSIGGPKRQVVLDCVVQEIDIPTGLLLFQWDSLDHVPLRDSYTALPSAAGQPYDYFHVNSIQQDGEDLVISARNTWAAYKVDHASGATIWQLGGKHSTFKLAPDAQFAFQHDVRVRGPRDSLVTLFDDGGGPPTVHQSRGLALHLDLSSKTATVAALRNHVPPVLASYEGNLQQLSDGHYFVGWGQQPYFTEFDSRGQVVFDGRFVDNNSNYRAYRFQWSGTPRQAPAVVVSGTGSNTVVYVSWNGATKVASWRVMGGSSRTSLQPIASASKDGFETAIPISGKPYVAVQALDLYGRVLSTTATVSG